MAGQSKEKGSKSGRKRRKPCQQRYVANNQRSKNKLRRVMRCNGETFAIQWQQRYYVQGDRPALQKKQTLPKIKEKAKRK